MVKDSKQWTEKSKNGAIHIMSIFIYFTINYISELNGSTIMSKTKSKFNSF